MVQNNIPYRESKLTRILKDSLGGNTKTILIATLSPLNAHIEESISTLKFADNAKQVLVKATINEVSGKEDAVVRKLRREVQHLKDILNMRRNNTDSEIQRELFILKEQNFKLRELASKGEYVEKVIKENQALKAEIVKFKQPQNSDGFLVWQNKPQEIVPDQRKIMSQTYFNKEDNKENIFMTEAVPEALKIDQEIEKEQIIKK